MPLTSSSVNFSVGTIDDGGTVPADALGLAAVPPPLVKRLLKNPV